MHRQAGPVQLLGLHPGTGDHSAQDGLMILPYFTSSINTILIKMFLSPLAENRKTIDLPLSKRYPAEGNKRSQQ